MSITANTSSDGNLLFVRFIKRLTYRPLPLVCLIALGAAPPRGRLALAALRAAFSLRFFSFNSLFRRLGTIPMHVTVP